MITREFKLYLNAGTNIAPVINANQFDQDEEWIFTLLTEDGTVYTPSTSAIIGLKTDGTTILNAGTVNSSGQVVITETEQMTAVPGSNVFELLIDGNTHGTANFVVFVERRPGDIDNPSESDISLFQEAIDAAGNIEQFQADISALQSGLSQEASTRSTQDAVLQAEIDQIIAPSGEAPSAAEVQNARIGVDGTTYDTLGNAIRTQVSDLKNALTFDSDDADISSEKSPKYNIYPDLTNHTIKTFPDATPVYSTYVPCKAGYKYVIKKSVSTSRFAIATTENVPAYQVATIDGVRDDTASQLEIIPTGNSHYLLIWFYYYSADSSINADTALSGISIEEKRGAYDRVARENISDLDSRLDNIEDISDITSELSGKENIYPQSSSMLVKTGTSESPLYSVYVPCVAGYEYTVKKTVASSRFAIATTQNVPVYNEPLIDIVQNNSASELSLTPTGNSHYLLIWFYYHSGDSSIGADTILASITVTQNSLGAKDVFARSEIEQLKQYIQYITVGEFNTSQLDNMNIDNISILY